jgi:hypothetical protein
LDFRGFVRTGEPFPPVEPSVSLPTVRKPGDAKPLPELAFGSSAGGVDDADG